VKHGPALARRVVWVTPVLDPAEARALLDSFDTSTVVGVRDRALIGVTQPNAVASDMRTEP
jgi:hypothetical protein